MPVTRVLLSALLLAGSMLVATPASAPAAPGRCLASRQSLDQLAMKADDVFTATVEKRRVEGRTVVYAVTVDRIYKGDLDTADASVSTPAAPRACGLPRLTVGADYVFFTAGSDLHTTSSAGTRAASDDRVARVEKLLGKGHSATPAEAPTATFTRVAGDRTSFERLAAPGAALVIVGVLGLLLVGALGRRRA